jgi:3-methyl-2-oxobutanoate hydroxymethyltransferase
MVALGRSDTLSVTVEEMAHHVAAVRAGVERALVVADLPFGSYQCGWQDAVRCGVVLLRAGAQAVKLEGGRARSEVVSALVDAGIPVMGHVGLTPQSVHALGGYKVQARTARAASELIGDTAALETAGCFSVVLECVPAAVSEQVTESLGVPTIGIGAGAGCDGQVLVGDDLLGITPGKLPRFVRCYSDLADRSVAAISSWVRDVHDGVFPSDAESYSMVPGEQETMEVLAGAGMLGRDEDDVAGVL